MVAVPAVLVAVLVFAAEEAGTPGPVELTTELDKTSYAVGVQVGNSLKRPGMEINVDLFIRAIRDVVAERELALSGEEVQQVLTDFQRRMMAKQMEIRQKEAEENLAAGKAFLEENATKEGVKVLSSGLQYKVLTEGTGLTPSATDRVKVNYRGTFIDGTEFDSSYKRGQPAEFAANRVITGWTEALQLMKEGAKWQLFIPANLAYGAQGRPPTMPPNSALIFEVELIEIVGSSE